MIPSLWSYVSPMSSRCRLARLDSVVVVGVEVVEHHTGQRSRQAELASDLTAGVDVVCCSWPDRSRRSDLGDGDAVQRGIQLAVARAGHAHPPSGVARPHRDRRHTGVPGEGRLAFEPGYPGGFSDQFGRGQLPAARKRKQGRGDVANSLADALGQGVDGFGEPGDVGQFVAGQLSDQAGHGASQSQRMRPRFARSSERAFGAWSGSSSCTRHNNRLIVAVRCATRTSRRSTNNFNSRETSSWEATGRSGSRR